METSSVSSKKYTQSFIFFYVFKCWLLLKAITWPLLRKQWNKFSWNSNSGTILNLSTLCRKAPKRLDSHLAILVKLLRILVICSMHTLTKYTLSNILESNSKKSILKLSIIINFINIWKGDHTNCNQILLYQS